MNEKLVENLFNKTTAICIGSIVVTAVLVKYFLKRQAELKKKSYPRDLVILHQFPPGLNAPRLLIIFSK